MALVWHDLKSFQRHLEDMKAFRHGHQNSRGPALLNDMPVPNQGDRRDEAGGTGGITANAGYQVTVPIWEIALPHHTQN